VRTLRHISPQLRPQKEYSNLLSPTVTTSTKIHITYGRDLLIFLVARELGIFLGCVNMPRCINETVKFETAGV